MGMFGLESSQGRRAALAMPAPLKVDLHQAKNMTRDERGLKFKSVETVPDLVANPGVVTGVKAASHDDFALDMYLQKLLTLPLKVAVEYSSALERVGVGGLSELHLARIESEQDLLDLGLRPGHSRRLFKDIQAHKQ